MDYLIYSLYTDIEEFEYLCQIAFQEGISQEEKIQFLQTAINLYNNDTFNRKESTSDNWMINLKQKNLMLYEKLLNDIITIYKNKEDHKNIIKYSSKLLKVDN